MIPPTVRWLAGTWHVTHSTLPMWKKARNVNITYARIPGCTKLLDTVRYQSRNSDKIKTITGWDKPGADSGIWDWRGKGWLKWITSHWEVLGHGDIRCVDGEQWVVTYFEESLFTPAGLDIYCRMREGLTPQVSHGLEQVIEALKEAESEVVRKLAGELFEVYHDSETARGF